MKHVSICPGLLANEIKEAQFVLESIRAKYTQELQVTRARLISLLSSPDGALVWFRDLEIVANA